MAIAIEAKAVAVKITSSPAVGWGRPFQLQLRDLGPTGSQGWFLLPPDPITNKAQATALIELFTELHGQLPR